MKPSSAFENCMITEQLANPKLTIDEIKQQYAQDEEIRQYYQKQEKEKFELMFEQKQKDILQKYGLPKKFLKFFEFKNLNLEEYIKSQIQKYIDKENQIESIQVVVRCSYDKNLLRALFRIGKCLQKFGISDFQIYFTRGQAQMLFITMYSETEQITLWNDSLDLIQNEYNWLVETIQNRIKHHFKV